MVLGLIAIGFTLAIAYIWVLRGFFSALIHLLCTVAAGAVAFAVWEPVSNWFLEKSPASGFWSVIGDSAWSLGLALPFVVTLVVLRIAMDVSLRAQCKLVPMADYVGGGVCGLLAGIISSGILVMSAGGFRLDAELMGYQPLAHQKTGNVTRQGGLLLPVDRITGSIYGTLSKTAFYDSDDSLGRYYPDVYLVPGTLRMNNNDGEARNTLRAADLRIDARYTVGEGRNLPINELLSDQWNPGPQRATDQFDKAYPVG